MVLTWGWYGNCGLGAAVFLTNVTSS